MITLHVFTEELSAKKVLDVLIPKIIPDNTSFKVYPHQGKRDLEKAFQDTIPSISRIPGSRIIVTLDQDSGDCKDVKRHIKELIGLNCHCEYLIRIACRELEAWYLGDLKAIHDVYPRFRPDKYQNRSNLRNVDSIVSPDKYLLRIVPELKIRSSLPKIEVAELISPFLNIENNRSTSFNQMIQAVRKLSD